MSNHRTIGSGPFRLENPNTGIDSCGYSQPQGLGSDTREIERQPSKKSEAIDQGTASQGPNEGNIIDWDGPGDPLNPQNWGSRKKWSIIVLISAITFNQYITRCHTESFMLIYPRAMSSTIFAPGVPQAMSKFHSTNQASATLLISIYVIGLVVGPLFLTPLSELYGRKPLMHVTNIAFLLAAILCAVSVNIPMLLIFRLVMGASTISLGGGYVVDLMEPEHRGRAINVWTVGPVLVCLQSVQVFVTFS